MKLLVLFLFLLLVGIGIGITVPSYLKTTTPNTIEAPVRSSLPVTSPIVSSSQPAASSVQPLPSVGDDYSNILLTAPGDVVISVYDSKKIRLDLHSDVESLTDDTDPRYSSPSSSQLYFQRPDSGTYYVEWKSPKNLTADLEILAYDRNSESKTDKFSLDLEANKPAYSQIVYDKNSSEKTTITREIQF